MLATNLSNMPLKQHRLNTTIQSLTVRQSANATTNDETSVASHPDNLSSAIGELDKESN